MTDKQYDIDIFQEAVLNLWLDVMYNELHVGDKITQGNIYGLNGKRVSRNKAKIILEELDCRGHLKRENRKDFILCSDEKLLCALMRELEKESDKRLSILTKARKRNYAAGVFSVFLFTILLSMYTVMPVSASGYEDNGTVGSATISVETPEWTRSNGFYAKVAVSGHNIVRIEAKVSRAGEWFDIMQNMDVAITENTDLYIRAIEADGKITTYSTTIRCIDRTPPQFFAMQEGKNLNVMVSDDQSGAMLVYINGKAHPTNNDTITYQLSDSLNYAIIQARDVAGNLSDYQQLDIDTSVFAPQTRSSTTYSSGSRASTAEKAESQSPEEPAKVDTPAAATEQQTSEGQGAAESKDTTLDQVETQAVYNIHIGGDQYSLEDIMSAGLPVMIFPNVDDTTLAVLIKQYSDYQQSSVEESPAPSPTDVGELPSVQAATTENESSSAIPDIAEVKEPENKTQANSLLITVILMVVAAAFLFIFKRKKPSGTNQFITNDNADYESDDDLYESYEYEIAEEDRNVSAFPGTAHAADMNTTATNM